MTFSPDVLTMSLHASYRLFFAKYNYEPDTLYVTPEVRDALMALATYTATGALKEMNMYNACAVVVVKSLPVFGKDAQNIIECAMNGRASFVYTKLPKEIIGVIMRTR